MAYSIDLRQRVVDAYVDGNDSYAEVAKYFAVGEATVDRWVALFRMTGSVAPRPHGGGATALVDELGLSILSDLAERSPDGNRTEFAAAYRKQTGVVLSVATVGRVLSQLGLTRKKRPSTRPSERPQKPSRQGRSTAQPSRQ